MGRIHLTRASRVLLPGTILLILPVVVLGFVTEIEPNNEVTSANLIQAGDTVYCACLTEGDLDHFRFQMPAGDSVYVRTFDCLGSQTNTYLTLFNQEYVILDVDNSSGPEAYSVVSYWSPDPETLIVRVMFGGTSLDSTYCLFVDTRSAVPEEYDFCETARVVTAFPYFNYGDTWGKSDEAGTPASDVFYQFHQPVLGDLSIEVCSEFFDARVQIISYCIGGYMDDASEGCELGATLVSYAVPPGDYYVMVEGVTADQAGQFSIQIEPFFPECPAPDPVILYSVGGDPFLDWPTVPEAEYYVIYQAPTGAGPFEHLDSTSVSFYSDPAGFTSLRRFYRVRTVCPWSN